MFLINIRSCLTVQLDVQEDTEQRHGAQQPADSSCPPTPLHPRLSAHAAAPKHTDFTALCRREREQLRSSKVAESTQTDRRNGATTVHLFTVPVGQCSVRKTRRVAERFLPFNVGFERQQLVKFTACNENDSEIKPVSVCTL